MHGPNAFQLVREPSLDTRRLLADFFLFTGFFLLVYREFIFYGEYTQAVGFKETMAEVWPHSHYLAENIAAGRLPFWNFSTWTGISFVAVPQVGFWYPLNWLYALGRFPDVLRADLLGHIYLLAGLTYVLTVHIFQSRLAVLWTTLSVVASFMALNWTDLGNSAILHTVAFMPLALLALLQILSRPRLGWTILLALTLATQIIGGYLQAFLYQMLLFGILTVFVLVAGLVTRRLGIRAAMGRGAGALAAVVLAASAGAVQLAPSAELLLSQSERSTEVSESFRSEFPPLPVISAYLGLPFDDWFALWIDQEALETSQSDLLKFIRGRSAGVTFGVFTMGFGLLALVRPRSILAFGFVLMFLTAVLVAAEYPPLFIEWFTRIPVIGSARFAFRILDAVGVLPFVIAGFGVAQVATHRPKSACHWQALFVSVVALVVLWSRARKWDYFNPGFELFLILALGGIWLSLNRLRWRAYGTVWMTACLLVEATFFLHDLKGPRSTEATYKPDPQYMAWSASRTDHDRVLLFPTHFGNLPAQIGLVTGDRMFYGKGPLPLARFAAVIDRAADNRVLELDAEGRLVDSHMETLDLIDWLDKDSAFLLDLLNVRWIVRAGDPGTFRGPWDQHVEAKLVRRDYEDLVVFENPDAFPIAFVSHAVEVCESEDEVLERMFRPGFDHRTTALTTVPVDTGGFEAASRPEPVVVREYSPNVVELEVDMSARGILVLTDMYYPGWTATIDGTERREVFPVHHLLRGVVVDEGRHVVRFEYLPSYMVPAMVTSVSALLICIAGLVVAGVRSARRDRGPARAAGSAGATDESPDTDR